MIKHQLPLILLIGSWCSFFAHGDSRSDSRSEPSVLSLHWNLITQKLPNGFGIEPKGVLSFQRQDGKEKASVELDLSHVKSFEEFDELWCDIKVEDSLSHAFAIHNGNPNTWDVKYYYQKRDITPGSWQRFRMDLREDDSGEYSKYSGNNKLRISVRNKPDAPWARIGMKKGIRFRNLKLIRRPFDVTMNTKEVRFVSEIVGDGFSYLIHVSNRSQTKRNLKIDVIPEGSSRFKVMVDTTSFTLPPNSSRKIPVFIYSTSKSTRDTLELTRYRVSVKSLDLPGQGLEPYRGYRPLYLYGMTPPKFKKAKIEIKGVREIDSQEIDHFVNWSYPGLGKLDFDMNEQFEFNLDQLTRLKGVLIHLLKSENVRQAKQVYEVYLQYLRLYQQFHSPIQSLGYASVLSKTLLDERQILSEMVDLYLIGKRAKLLNAEHVELANEVLSEMLYRSNRHLHSYSGYQLKIIRVQIKAALALKRWYFIADALKGDGGVETVYPYLKRADGSWTQKRYRLDIVREGLARLQKLCQAHGIPLEDYWAEKPRY